MKPDLIEICQNMFFELCSDCTYNMDVFPTNKDCKSYEPMMISIFYVAPRIKEDLG